MKNVAELLDKKAQYMIDLDEAAHVEALMDSTGRFWLNVDGICLVRVDRVLGFTSDDPTNGRQDHEPHADPLGAYHGRNK